MCRALSISKGGFYTWLRRGPCARVRHEADILTPQVRVAFEQSRRTYGCVRIGEALKDIGIHTSARRIRRIMRADGLIPRRVKSYKCMTKADGKPLSPDFVKRKFTVDRLNLVWVGDITQVMTLEGWLYLATMLDLCSKYLVGWATGDRINDDLVLRAFMMAFTHREPAPGFIVHSDHGSQYTSNLFRANVRLYGGVQSMGTVGDCFDNAPAESFNATIKGECLDHEVLLSRDHATKIIFDYIEVFYNRTRKHSSIGYMSPSQFEKNLGMPKRSFPSRSLIRT
jgi:transposase InsO family protein